MKTLVIGAGAIGGTIAVLVKNAGYDVSILCHSKETRTLFETEGFRLHGVKGDFTVQFPCYDSVDELEKESFDFILIATKYQAMPACAAAALPLLKKDGLVVGMPGGAHPQKLDELRDMFQTVLPTSISNDITREQYSKLIINSCINATAAITGQVLGKCIEDRRAKKLFLSIAREGMYVARAMGIRVPTYG